MKEVTMDIEWRTAQFFLEEEGICEVEVDDDQHNKLRCSCVGFAKAARCKHTKFVRDAMDANGGALQIQIPADMSDEEAILAMMNKDSFREFVIKYGKVEVI
jgi:hypothetical protein